MFQEIFCSSFECSHFNYGLNTDSSLTARATSRNIEWPCTCSSTGLCYWNSLEDGPKMLCKWFRKYQCLVALANSLLQRPIEESTWASFNILQAGPKTGVQRAACIECLHNKLLCVIQIGNEFHLKIALNHGLTTVKQASDSNWQASWDFQLFLCWELGPVFTWGTSILNKGPREAFWFWNKFHIIENDCRGIFMVSR